MKILVAVDLSASCEKVVQVAQNLAAAAKAGIWLLHVAPPDPDFVGYEAGPQAVRDSASDRFHAEHRQIQAIAEQLRGEGLDATALLVQGSTAETIVHEALKLDVDMVVIGSHGRFSLHQLLQGSDSRGILHKSRCPVLVVPIDA